MTWLPVLLALSALLGVVITNIVAVRNNRAQDARWRTELAALEERTDRSLNGEERKDKRANAVNLYKWASERAVAEDEKVVQSGVDALKALLEGTLLDEDMKPLVIAALSSSYAAEIRAIEAGGEDLEVVQVMPRAPAMRGLPMAGLTSSEPDHQAEEARG